MGVTLPTDLAVSVTRFLTDYLVGERGCSDATVESYSYAVTNYLLHVEATTGVGPDRVRLADFTADSARSFLDAVEASGCCTSTRNQRLAALKSLAQYAMRENAHFILEGQRVCAIKSKKVPKGEIDYFEADQMRELLAAPDRSTSAGLREAAAMSLLYDTGARVSELCGLRLKDLRLSGSPTATLHGKGNKTRTVPISSATADLMLEYLEDIGVDPCAGPYLMTHALRPPKRSGYTRQGIYAMVNRMLRLAAGQHPDIALPAETHPHAFRASKAIHLLDDGSSLIAVRDFLGHVSVSTTQRYLRVRLEQRRSVVEQAYPEISKAPEDEWRTDSELMKFLRGKCRAGR